MTEVIFEGNRVTLYKAKDCDESDGIIIATGNVHLFLGIEATAELVSGLNKTSYELFQTRNEIFQ